MCSKINCSRGVWSKKYGMCLITSTQEIQVANLNIEEEFCLLKSMSRDLQKSLDIANNWREETAYFLVLLLTLYQRWVLLSWSGVGVQGTSRETCCSLASNTLKEVTFLVIALRGYACTLLPWGLGGLLAPWKETVGFNGSINDKQNK